MTKVVVCKSFPLIKRDSFLTPFDKMFEQIVQASFPGVKTHVGVKTYVGIRNINNNEYTCCTKKCVKC